MWKMQTLAKLLSGFALPIAIVAKCEKNNKIGAKNINLATTIGERKITGENFCLASKRHLRLKGIASCRLMVINVYLNCQLTPQLSTDLVADRVQPGHALLTYGDRPAVLTTATGNGQNDRP